MGISSLSLLLMPTPILTHFESPIRMSKKDNFFNHFDSSTSSFVVTMLVMTINTISIEEQLARMACAIAKLTKTIEEKDIQIASLISKVVTQTQNTINLSQGLTLRGLHL